jgi:EmrB/QacA subfamily drug resistance transporter
MIARELTGHRAAAHPLRWRGFVVCMLAGFMTLLDTSIVNVSLPSIQQGLSATPATLSWVVSGYALAFGLVLVPAGKVGDSYGLKGTFLVGLGLFTAVSLLCGLSPTPAWLVVARLLQGVAAGMLTPQIIGMNQRLFTGDERGKAFGIYGAVIGVSTAIGPLLGGVIIQAMGVSVGWRWVFLVNVPIGVVAVALGCWLLPRLEVGRRHGLDLVGMVLLGCGIAALMLPPIEAEQRSGSANWWLVGVGVVLLVLFVAWERILRGRGAEPLVNLGLLRNWSYSVGGVVGLFYFAGYTGVFFVVSLYFQQGLGYSALQAGLAGLPFVLGSATSVAVVGRMVYRVGRSLVVAGVVLVELGLIGTAVLVYCQPSGPMWLVVLGPLLVAGIGNGLVVGPNQALALEDVPPAESGAAAGVLQTVQRLGSAFGIAITGSLFFGIVTANGGDYAAGGGWGLAASVVLVVFALFAGVIDLFRPGNRAEHAAVAAMVPPAE